MHFFQWFPKDYAAATAHLSIIEDIAYRRLLDLYYVSEAPFDSDVATICRRIRMPDHQEEVLAVLSEFFLDDDGLLRNSRADRELQAVYSKSDKARKSAEARWSSKGKNDANAMRTHSERNANAIRSQCEGNATHDSLRMTHDLSTQVPPKSPKGDVDVWEGFQEFWDAFAHKQNRPDSEKVWNRLKPNEELRAAIMSKVRAYVGSTPDKQYRKHPAAWLRARKWEDEIVVKGQLALINGNRGHMPHDTRLKDYSDTGMDD
jgi:uncharacterized protein YdaU (DUF1376 family)